MSNMRVKDLRPAPALIEFKGMKFLITDRPTDITINNYISELKKNNVNTVVRVCEPSYDAAELETHGITVKDLAFEDGTSPPPHIIEEWFEILKENFRKSTNATIITTTTTTTPTTAIVANYQNKTKRFSLKHKPKTAPTTPTTETPIENVLLPLELSGSCQATCDLVSSPNGENNITAPPPDSFQQIPEACVAVHCVAGLGRAPVLVALALIELGLKYEAAVEMIRDKRRGAINAKQLTFLEKYKPKSRLKHKNGHKNSCCVQ